MNGYDITLQWSKAYIEKANFKYFYKELLDVIIKNNCLIYLTQDILLTKNDYRNIYKHYEKFIKSKNMIDPKNIFSNELYERLLKK